MFKTFKATLAATALIMSSFVLLSAEEIPASETKDMLKNGDMTKGTVLPFSWEKISNWGPKIKVVRDTKVFHSKPASLCLMPVKGKGKGCVSQIFPGTNGKFKVSGWFKVEEGAKYTNANVAVQLFDKSWKPIKWIQISHLKGSEWTSFEKTIDIDSNPAHIQFLLMIDGHAKVWMDDVKMLKVD